MAKITYGEGETLPYLFGMTKMNVLHWVQQGMPVDVDGTKMFLHHSNGALDPSGEFCLVYDKNAYDDDFDGSQVTISPAEIKKVKLLIPDAELK